MAYIQSPTDLALDPENGLLKRISEIETDSTDAQNNQTALKTVLEHLHNKGAYILEKPDKEKLTNEERKRLIKFLHYVYKKLPSLKKIYNLLNFINLLECHLSANELEKLLPAKKKPRKHFVAR